MEIDPLSVGRAERRLERHSKGKNEILSEEVKDRPAAAIDPQHPDPPRPPRPGRILLRRGKIVRLPTVEDHQVDASLDQNEGPFVATRLRSAQEMPASDAQRRERRFGAPPPQHAARSRVASDQSCIDRWSRIDRHEGVVAHRAALGDLEHGVLILRDPKDDLHLLLRIF